MDTAVTIPVWVLILILVLAGIAVLDRFLVPSMRWAVKRRANRAIDELNSRLRLRIQPFKLTKRQVLIDQLLFDPQVNIAAEEFALENNIPREVAMEKAKRYAREIVPSFSAYAYFKVGTRLARAISDLLYRVRIGVANEEAIENIEPQSSVVFVINHRSNMDYYIGDIPCRSVFCIELCGWGVGAGVYAAQFDPLNGGLFCTPGFAQSAVSQNLRALC